MKSRLSRRVWIWLVVVILLAGAGTWLVLSRRQPEPVTFKLDFDQHYRPSEGVPYQDEEQAAEFRAGHEAGWRAYAESASVTVYPDQPNSMSFTSACPTW